MLFLCLLAVMITAVPVVADASSGLEIQTIEPETILSRLDLLQGQVVEAIRSNDDMLLFWGLFAGLALGVVGQILGRAIWRGVWLIFFVLAIYGLINKFS